MVHASAASGLDQGSFCACGITPLLSHDLYELCDTFTFLFPNLFLFWSCCSCRQGLSPPVVPVWELKGWHICIPVAGIRRGLLYLSVLQPLGGHDTGAAGTLPCTATAHGPAGCWIDFSCLILLGEGGMPSIFMVNLCLK